MIALLDSGKLALSFWREILIVILLGSCWALKSDVDLKVQKITHLDSVILACEKTRDELKSKIDLIDKANAEATIAHNDAETKRLQIITDFAKQVNIIKNQTPPTDCKDAISWAVQNKADLSWKK